ncbi:MAG: outer membrane lipoprotein chaperone LolA [Terriglobales bacterium]|jgi:outer membrane lipoprotein carrier protein
MAPAPERQLPVAVLSSRVDAHYNQLQTLQTDFAETYSGAGITRTESGTLWLKRPGHMRWEYHQPREKLFLTDGHTAWFYNPGERQARRAPVKKLEDLRTPLGYLLGRTKLEKEFSGLSIAPDAKAESPANFVLRGVPRHQVGISSVVMEVSPEGQFERLVAQMDDGSTTEFRFSGEKENLPIPDQRFQFSPPPGVETFDTEDLGQ